MARIPMILIWQRRWSVKVDPLLFRTGFEKKIATGWSSPLMLHRPKVTSSPASIASSGTCNGEASMTLSAASTTSTLNATTMSWYSSTELGWQMVEANMRQGQTCWQSVSWSEMQLHLSLKRNKWLEGELFRLRMTSIKISLCLRSNFCRE